MIPVSHLILVRSKVHYDRFELGWQVPGEMTHTKAFGLVCDLDDFASKRAAVDYGQRRWGEIAEDLT